MKGDGITGEPGQECSVVPTLLTDEPGSTPSLLFLNTLAHAKKKKKLGVQVEGWMDGTVQCEELTNSMGGANTSPVRDRPQTKPRGLE